MKLLRQATLFISLALLLAAGATAQEEIDASGPTFDVFPVPRGSHPHDVAPSPDGSIVWYTGQLRGVLGRLDPETGDVTEIPLGSGSSPHGVIVGPDGAPWITDSGLNAIVKVDPETEEVFVYSLPTGFSNANLNTASFDGDGVLWFTGQNGVYGSFDPETETMNVYRAPRGRGPYGIHTTPDGEVYYVSLAAGYLGDIDEETGEITEIDPPTPNAGTRRVWSDSQGQLWITEFNAGNLAMYVPETGEWREWQMPFGANSRPYAVVVDERDDIWISDFGDNSLVRFDAETETFESFPLMRTNATVRQMLVAEGVVWAAQSGLDSLLRITLEPEGEDE
jgi:virginiamycin B lyase